MTVTRAEFIRLLEGIESEFPVTEWTVRAIRVWPLVRLSLYSTTFGAGSAHHGLRAGRAQQIRNVASGLAAWAGAFSRDSSANRRPNERADAVFLSYSAGRRPLLDGKRFDVRAGPFVKDLQELGARSLVWEMSPFGEYNIPRYPPSFLVQPHLLLLRGACQLLPPGRDGARLEQYDAFVARVGEAGLRFAQGDVTRLRRDVHFLRRLADRFARWLEQVRPVVGFVANTGLVEQAFCLACRERGITSVELQHGVQGAFHPSYGSWTAVPPDGWETRARIFWNWDDESAAAINQWASHAPGRHLAVVGGDPWREMWLNEDSELVRRSTRLVLEHMRSSGGERHILVTLTSQGEVIPAPVLEALRASPSGWRFWFRLHHVDQAARRPEAARLLRQAGGDVGLMEFATEAPLHALLLCVDCHLTVSLSTVVAEAAAHGLPSVACGREAASFFAEEIAAGLLITAESSNEILEALHRSLAHGRRPMPPTSSRTRALLQQLLSGGPVVAAEGKAP